MYLLNTHSNARYIALLAVLWQFYLLDMKGLNVSASKPAANQAVKCQSSFLYSSLCLSIHPDGKTEGKSSSVHTGLGS